MTYGVYTLKQHPPPTVSSIYSFINPDSSLQRKHWKSNKSQKRDLPLTVLSKGENFCHASSQTSRRSKKGTRKMICQSFSSVLKCLEKFSHFKKLY